MRTEKRRLFDGSNKIIVRGPDCITGRIMPSPPGNFTSAPPPRSLQFGKAMLFLRRQLLPREPCSGRVSIITLLLGRPNATSDSAETLSGRRRQRSHEAALQTTHSSAVPRHIYIGGSGGKGACIGPDVAGLSHRKSGGD